MAGFGDQQALDSYFVKCLLSLTARRKVFVSYFHGDQTWAQTFVDTFGRGDNKVFVPKALGLNYEDDEIQSSNPSYVMGQIRERRIADSTVQIVLIGPCTHSRRYIDWEIKRSLSNGNGLIGILIPPHTSARLPERFQANWSPDGNGYATYHFYPTSPQELRGWIEDAFEARTARQALIHNAQETWAYNKECKVSGLVGTWLQHNPHPSKTGFHPRTAKSAVPGTPAWVGHPVTRSD